MSILYSTKETQLLLDRTLNRIIESKEECTLEFLIMMIKVKRYEKLLEYFINHDYIGQGFLYL